MRAAWLVLAGVGVNGLRGGWNSCLHNLEEKTDALYWFSPFQIKQYIKKGVPREMLLNDFLRLRVVSNFGGGDCVAGEIHTRACVKFRGDRRVSSKFRARTRLFRLPHKSPSPKLETIRSLWLPFNCFKTLLPPLNLGSVCEHFG